MADLLDLLPYQKQKWGGNDRVIRGGIDALQPEQNPLLRALQYLFMSDKKMTPNFNRKDVSDEEWEFLNTIFQAFTNRASSEARSDPAAAERTFQRYPVF